MKYGKKKSDSNNPEPKKLDKEMLKGIKAFGSVVIIKGGSLVDDEDE